jgi:hypothetical protein
MLNKDKTMEKTLEQVKWVSFVSVLYLGLAYLSVWLTDNFIYAF